jgi:hypothetical protein
MEIRKVEQSKYEYGNAIIMRKKIRQQLYKVLTAE